MNYYISDLHFFCRSQIDNGGKNYDGRPFKTMEEMHESILKRLRILHGCCLILSS